MKISLTVIITSIVLGVALLLNVLHIDILVFALILFATGMIAWTLRQYDEHHIH